VAALTPRPIRGQVAVPPPVRGPGGIVAVVNQDVITRRELDRRVTMLMEDTALRRGLDPTTLERDRARFERAVLDFLIEERLLLQDAKRNNITASDAEIDAEIDRRIETKYYQVNLQDVDELYKLLRENYGYSREEFREQIRDYILLNRLLWTKYFQEPFVTPGERREYYRAHPEEFQTPAELTFRMIVVDDSAEAPRIIEELDAELERKPFQEVAREYYEARGEELFLWRKDLAELKSWRAPLPQILSKMKPGEVQRHIRIANGWRYIEMVDLKFGKQQTFEEAQALIVQSLRMGYRIREKVKLDERLKKEAHIQDFLQPQAGPPRQAPPPPAATLEPGKVLDASPDPPRPRDGGGNGAPPKPGGTDGR